MPTIALPEVFTAFWEEAKSEAVTVPMDVKLTYLPEHSTLTVEVYLVNLQNYKEGQRLYGYLCKPKAPGKYPVLFHPPGAGIRPTQPLLFLPIWGLSASVLKSTAIRLCLMKKRMKTSKKLLEIIN